MTRRQVQSVRRLGCRGFGQTLGSVVSMDGTERKTGHWVQKKLWLKKRSWVQLHHLPKNSNESQGKSYLSNFEQRCWPGSTPLHTWGQGSPEDKELMETQTVKWRKPGKGRQEVEHSALIFFRLWKPVGPWPVRRERASHCKQEGWRSTVTWSCPQLANEQTCWVKQTVQEWILNQRPLFELYVSYFSALYANCQIVWGGLKVIILLLGRRGCEGNEA